MKQFTVKDLMYYLDRKRDSILYLILKANVYPVGTFGFNNQKIYNVYQLEPILNEYFKSKRLVQDRKNAKRYKLEQFEIINDSVILTYHSKLNFM